jgi:hypothetical protein
VGDEVVEQVNDVVVVDQGVGERDENPVLDGDPAAERTLSALTGT